MGIIKLFRSILLIMLCYSPAVAEEGVSSTHSELQSAYNDGDRGIESTAGTKNKLSVSPKQLNLKTLLNAAKTSLASKISGVNTKKFEKINEVTVPPRIKNYKIVYHLYIIFAEKRDKLLKYCQKKGIEAKIHYPIPMYRQPAMKFLGHKIGDFPASDRHAKSIISFPCDQHLSLKEMDYVCKTVKEFYGKN